VTAAHPLVRLIDSPKKRVIGLMSGTSLDGIDAALVEIEGHGEAIGARLLGFETTPYDETTRAEIHELFHAETRVLCQGSFRLGERFAEAALALGPADLIGSHGQTVWHQPPSACSPGETPSTLQIAEPAVIAARTGVVTVGDFRVADLAHGGEGAPLVPYVDYLLYRKPGATRALQNIGGISNVTLLGEGLASVRAFDNGPGNMMIDALAPLASGGLDAIDRDGRWSEKGVVQRDLLAELLDDEFLKKAPPKSTGRERYGQAVTLAWHAAHVDRRPVDLLATLVAFTARAIGDSYRRFVLPAAAAHRLDEVLVGGGGAHNRTLMRAIEGELGPVPVRPFGEGGISADAKEAVAFAVLAVEALHGSPGNVTQVTGARRPCVLGKICLP
jgi:anhydro-N-acetylmuramic acid kinase